MARLATVKYRRAPGPRAGDPASRTDETDPGRRRSSSFAERVYYLSVEGRELHARRRPRPATSSDSFEASKAEPDRSPGRSMPLPVRSLTVLQNWDCQRLHGLLPAVSRLGHAGRAGAHRGAGVGQGAGPRGRAAVRPSGRLVLVEVSPEPPAGRRVRVPRARQPLPHPRRSTARPRSRWRAASTRTRSSRPATTGSSGCGSRARPRPRTRAGRWPNTSPEAREYAALLEDQAGARGRRQPAAAAAEVADGDVERPRAESSPPSRSCSRTRMTRPNGAGGRCSSSSPCCGRRSSTAAATRRRPSPAGG